LQAPFTTPRHDAICASVPVPPTLHVIIPPDVPQDVPPLQLPLIYEIPVGIVSNNLGLLVVPAIEKTFKLSHAVGPSFA